VFDYNLIEGKARKESGGVKTEIIVNFYSVDFENGKFIKTETKEFKSTKYELDEFDEGKPEGVKKEDPFYKY
jgi:hypothetical protein